MVPESEEEDDNCLSVIDEDMSTSQLGREAAGSVGVSRPGGSGSRQATTNATAGGGQKRPATGKAGDQLRKKATKGQR